MKKALIYVLEYLAHRSTWVGIVAALGYFGVTLSVEVNNALIDAGVAIFSAVMIFLVDAKVDKSDVVKEKLGL